MSQSLNLRRVGFAVVGGLVVGFGFVVWSWFFTTSRLSASARRFGIYPSPTEAMMAEIQQGWVGIQEAWIRDARPEMALLGDGTHVWFVTACVWAASRVDGSPVGSATHDFDLLGTYYVQTREGWVPMSEDSATFVGFWMKIYGLAGGGGGQIVESSPSKPECVRRAG